MNLKVVNIYSDGGARPNPGVGGYGVILSYKGVKKEFYKGYYFTTNNRMELTGVITGLEKLKTKSKVNIYTDSQYTINGIEKGWAKKWKDNSWIKSNKTKAINSDLWEKLLNLIEKHEVKFYWVKGHNGHKENERCDELATIALQGSILYNDKGFELENEKILSKKNNKKDLIKKILNKNIDKNIKIKNEGQACRKCGESVEKKIPKKKNNKNKQFYYKFYLNCPGCNTNYFIDEAKVMVVLKNNIYI